MSGHCCGDDAVDAQAAAPETIGTPAADVPGTPDEPGYHDTKKAYLRRLRLIEGQVRGISRMVEEDTYCIDVLTQVSAVSKALESLAMALADDHIHHCVHHAASSGDPGEIDAKLDEVMVVVKRLLK